jgi:LysR family transcriptional regulator of gallate degradation
MRHIRLKEDQLLPNLRHVRLLTLVTEGLSLRKAAQRLRLSQPAVTLGLRALERHYGVPLFERRATGLTETEFGAALVRRAGRCIFYLTRALSKFCPDPDRPSVTRLERLLNLLTVSQLRALAAMDEYDGFRSSAEHIGLSVPSVHRAIGNLEAAVGAKLVHREKYGGSLNDLGHEIAVLFSLALRELRSATADMNALNGQLEGTITVGCVRVTASILLPTTIQKCVQQFPGMRFLVEQDHYEYMLEHLRAGRLDYICTTVRPDIPREFRAEKLFSSELCIVCGPSHPLAREPKVDIEMLASFPWIGSQAATGAANRLEAMFELEGLPTPTAAVTTLEFSLVRSLLFQTNFLAMATRGDLGIDHALAGLCVLPSAVPDPHRDVWLLSRRDLEPTTIQNEFVRLLRATTRESSVDETKRVS